MNEKLIYLEQTLFNEINNLETEIILLDVLEHHLKNKKDRKNKKFLQLVFNLKCLKDSQLVILRELKPHRLEFYKKIKKINMSD